ncbi:exonuclease VII large subunit [Mariniflexile fucanivorans]|uniref:Exonuclease VII large subunit n=1 Tax=Mariniflexile fucanivorans TaxID=264023 RepID=A0A4R1R9Y0_9FLAO|nr:exodeoxyribonuclease VII large subunit [Mariniflexile fucanivorans]TCL62498.1 exonuclease VII large subunit [Mariniflexile fucanivorans]
MSKTDNTITISTLLSLYANSLSSTMDSDLIVVEGFFSNNNNKLYGQYYYDEIVSKEKQHKITIQITHNLKSKLTTGNYYNFQGYISRGQSLDNDSRLKVYFRVTKILEHKEEVQLISKAEYNIVQARFERDFPLITDILSEKVQQGQKPILDVITGVQSTSRDDYLGQLPDYIYYEIRHYKCNLSTKDELLKFLSSNDFSNTDLLIILRGGGSGLEVFNEIDLCKKAIELPIPFITGIGHDADKTLLEKVADRGFSTPTAVGSFLQSIVNNYNERIKVIKAKDEELVRFKKQAESERSLLSNQILSQKKNLNIVWIVLAVFIVVIGVLMFKIINQ